VGRCRRRHARHRRDERATPPSARNVADPDSPDRQTRPTQIRRGASAASRAKHLFRSVVRNPSASRAGQPASRWLVTDITMGNLLRVPAVGNRDARYDWPVAIPAEIARGRIAAGAATADGTARLLDEAATAAGRALLARKYLMSRLGNGLVRVLRLRRPPVIGIAVTV